MHQRYLETNLSLISSQTDFKEVCKSFTDMLRTHLVLKEIVTGEEFDKFKDFIQYDLQQTTILQS